jgi:hypothetical protein
MVDFATEGLDSGGGIVVVVEAEDAAHGVGEIGDYVVDRFWHMHRETSCVCCG